jgi:hypothetical protein
MNKLDSLLKTASEFLETAPAFLDWPTPAQPSWLPIGQDDVLFERTLSAKGFVFVGQLKLDRETASDLGEFGSEERHGSLPAGDGRFFYPPISFNDYVRMLAIHRSLSLDSARAHAEMNLRRDLAKALAHEKKSPFYTLTVSVTLADYPDVLLGEKSVSGLSATTLVPLTFDSDVEQLFDNAKVELVLEVIEALPSIYGLVRKHR